MKQIDSMSDTPGLKVLIEIWELIEIMLIDFRVKGKMMIGQLLEDLLAWSCQNNSVAAELEMKAINSADQFNCPEYWDLICSYLLTGNLNHASELLQVRSVIQGFLLTFLQSIIQTTPIRTLHYLL